MEKKLFRLYLSSLYLQLLFNQGFAVDFGPRMQNHDSFGQGLFLALAHDY